MDMKMLQMMRSAMSNVATNQTDAPPAWRQRADAAMREFERFALDAGWPYKKGVLDFNADDHPTWQGIDEERGQISINPAKHDPEAVIHEMAHGMHERMRRIAPFNERLTDVGSNGEQFAQMIRYVVQRRMKQPWMPDCDDAFVRKFDGEWSRFKAWLEDKYTFIVKTPGVCGGKPRIDGHRIRVQDVATLFEHQRLTADEICDRFTSISLSQVHAALTYYYDHYEEVEQQLRDDERFVEEFKRQHPERVR